MKLKKKPVKPKRKKETAHYYFDLDDFDTVIELVTACEQVNLNLKDASFSHYYEFLTIKGPWIEPHTEYQKRVQIYEQKMEAYNKWYKDNQEDIDLELKRREQVKQEKKQEKKQRQIDLLQKRIGRLKNEQN